MKKIVLFDLDGTLTDSREGVLNSVRYMLKKMGLKSPGEAALRSFIGPPLKEMLETLYNLTESEAQSGIEFYREYYRNEGIKQLSVYSGIDELLTELSTEYYLAVATSKPEFFARQVLENTGLEKYFSGIFGADLTGERSKKADVIAYALNNLDKSPAVMIGDRKFDILGARKNDVKSIGVLYGFGDREELTEAQADIMVERVEEVAEAVKRAFLL
ncbi:HAD family hydrolase [Enterococcus sp. AZ196]|uniref:HAD family hydrolase n=1 Tax=Enterococcus sp. AZ196 TaxID=2774659 RepID=UPI003D2D8FB6